MLRRLYAVLPRADPPEGSAQCAGAGALAELYGKESGFCHGRGGSMHVTKVESGLLGANGIVGGGIPLATGSAMADASSEKPGPDSSWQTMLWI